MNGLIQTSLLPYLNSKSEFYIEIGVPSIDSGEIDQSPPFLVFDDSDPLSGTFHARVVSDAGSLITNILITKQRDQYALKHDNLWPMNNTDIDLCWQEALKNREADTMFEGLVALGNQFDHQKKPLPFQSVFYCRKKNHYFHPPCPGCGGDLILCKDDDLLLKKGLAAYAASLKRYLYCPACAEAKGLSGFYKYSLEDDDPRQLNDCRILILKFGTAPVTTAEQQFICPSCPDKSLCFGETGQAANYILPLSFYPFYLKITTADKLKAPDFLKLLSGATVDAVGTNSPANARRRSHINALIPSAANQELYFFKNDPRLFFEILYLKLVFFEDLAEQVLKDLNRFRPEFGLSMDRIHVTPNGLNGLLPFWWNFKVNLQNIGGRPSDSFFLPDVPPAYGLHFLGIVCFFILLENKNQERRLVYEAIESQFEAMFGSDESEEYDLKQAFLPENIFFDPQGQNVSPQGMSFWKKTLNLGWMLLKASMQQSGDWSDSRFFKSISDLRTELKTVLFTEPVVLSASEPVSEVIETAGAEQDAVITNVPHADALTDKLTIQEKQQIYTILQGIKHKWKSQSKTAPIEPPVTAEPPIASIENDNAYDEPDEETITVFHDYGEQAASKMNLDSGEIAADNETQADIPGSKALPEDQESDILHETVVISTESAKALMGDTSETLNIKPSPEEHAPPSSSHISDPDGFDQLNETMVVRVPAAEAPKVEPVPAEQFAAQPSMEPDEKAMLDETFILNKARQPKDTPKTSMDLIPTAVAESDKDTVMPNNSGFGDDEQLNRTMIINPKKLAANMKKKAQANEMAPTTVKPPQAPKQQAKPDEGAEGDFLDKTVIIRSTPRGPKGSGK